MSQYTLSALAKLDLAEALAYIAGFDERAADRVLLRIEAKLSQLSRNPEMGESFEIHGRRMRRFTVRPYVLIYATDPNGVYVVRILHGARDIDYLMD